MARMLTMRRLEGNTVMAVVLEPSIFYDNSRYGIVLITYSDASHTSSFVPGHQRHERLLAIGDDTNHCPRISCCGLVTIAFGR